jgi:hypothetical protein
MDLVERKIVDLRDAAPMHCLSIARRRQMLNQKPNAMN